MASNRSPNRLRDRLYGLDRWNQLLLAVLTLSALVVAAGMIVLGLAPAVRGPNPPAVLEDATTPQPSPTTRSAPELTPQPQGTDTVRTLNTPELPPVIGTVLLELDGSGEMATERYQWPACEKAVFYWSVAAGDFGEASFILNLRPADGAEPTVLANEFALNVAEPLRGASLRPLVAGYYALATENTDSPWMLRVECQDGQVASDLGIDLAGQYSGVSTNYALPACRNSVFLWSVDPDASGLASMVLKLYQVGRSWPDVLVNEVAQVLRQPFRGEVLHSLDGGDYYLVLENLSGPWTVRWECRD